MHYADTVKSMDFNRTIQRSSNALDSRFKQEITRLFYKQAPFVSFGLFFIIAAAYFVLQGELPTTLLRSWAIAMLFISSSILLCYFGFQRSEHKDNTRFWLTLYIAISIVQEFSLGMLGAMSALINDDTSRFFILFLLAGSTAGAIASHGMLFSVFLLSVTGLLLPVAITYALSDLPLAGVLLTMTLVFFFFMLFVGHNYSVSIRNNIYLWIDLEREIESRKKTEAELLSAKQAAEVASQAKNHFLASISHELRTPLNGIIGFVSALGKTPLDADQRGYTNHIDSCSKNLLHMVSDVLDISTIEAGKMELHPYPFSLEEEMQEVAALAQRLSEEKGLKFEYHLAEELPRSFIGDSHRLKQILNNLLNNAIKYTERGHIRLEAGLSSMDEQTTRITFVVEDSGIGIPKDDYRTLFDTFTQGSNPNSRRYDGVGLGLSIVARLLQAMHGSIEFHSEVGKGSRFEITLPFEQNLLPPPAESTSELEGQPHTAGSDLSRLRVLIADDNHINRLVLKTFLDPYKVPYTEAASGREALEQLNQDEFDLVLIDINMPDLSGIEVLHHYCSNNSVCPRFVAVTAHAFSNEIDEFLATGFDACLIKPVAENELVALLKGFAV